MTDTLSIPIFPLNTILFPNGHLPLRIFEPRYLDMISECMKKETGFGICLIKEGKETGIAASVHSVGTLCNISYFNAQSDGVLVITASGQQRFEIISQQVKSNQLIIAEVNLLPTEDSCPLPEEYDKAAALLKKLYEQLGQPYTKIEKHFDCASWVSSRLTELVPFNLTQKQRFLTMDDPIERMQSLWDVIKSLSETPKQ